MDSTSMNWKPALLQKCLNMLQSMKHPLKDDRPKTEQKLLNVLQKVTDVCYLSSVLNVIFKYGHGEEIYINEVEEVRKSDKQLADEIAAFALNQGEKQNRIVLVLPCDSNLHIVVASNVEEWYAEKTKHYNKDIPIEGIATASCIPYDLGTEEVIEELTRHGYINFNDSKVHYKLPNVDVQLELEQALLRFHGRIRVALDPLSARGHEFFSREIIVANGNIQSRSAEAIRLYCEKQYSEKYSLYRQIGTRAVESSMGGVIRQMENTTVKAVGGETGGDSQPESMDAEEEEDGAQILPGGRLELIPLTLTCEMAHILVKLCKRKQKPETLSDFGEFLRYECGILYVISPKYILSNIIKEGRDIPPNFEFNILLGESVTNKPLKFGNLTDVANALTFPGVDKAHARHETSSDRRFQSLISRRRYEPMETNTYDPQKDVFQTFQKYASDVAKAKVERHRSIPIMMDKDAELRCQQRFLNWIKETKADTNKRFTKETFTKELIDLGYEFCRLSAEDVKKLLVDCEYLEIKDPQRKVVYNWSHKKPNVRMVNEDFTLFRRYWEKDYKPSDSEDASGISRPPLPRKRPGSMASAYSVKRQRVIDI